MSSEAITDSLLGSMLPASTPSIFNPLATQQVPLPATGADAAKAEDAQRATRDVSDRFDHAAKEHDGWCVSYPSVMNVANEMTQGRIARVRHSPISSTQCRACSHYQEGWHCQERQTKEKGPTRSFAWCALAAAICQRGLRPHDASTRSWIQVW
jgi:hypothetical protein